MSESSQIRRVVGGNETFAQGHQVVGARTYKRKIPSWAVSDSKVKRLVLRAFPKMFDDPTARIGAARWASVIQLYFRLGWTRAQVAEELGSSTRKIKDVILHISRASKGLRSDGRGPLGKPKGRPKKAAPK